MRLRFFCIRRSAIASSLNFTMTTRLCPTLGVVVLLAAIVGFRAGCFALVCGLFSFEVPVLVWYGPTKSWTLVGSCRSVCCLGALFWVLCTVATSCCGGCRSGLCSCFWRPKHKSTLPRTTAIAQSRGFPLLELGDESTVCALFHNRTVSISPPGLSGWCLMLSLR